MIVPHHLGHKLGNLVHFGKRLIENPAHVLDRGFGGKRTESDNLRHVVYAVLSDDVLYCPLASVHAKVDVEVGIGNALGVKKTLENKVVS